MQNNVINFQERLKKEEPQDLLTLDEIAQKYGYKYGYLYKYSCLAKKEGKNHISIYNRGKIKLSESEVIEFFKEKVNKKYGRN
ncbi:MAG: hypothetical protein LUH11_03210 [Candidatus Gastranaerophilales bacterium]|nr:hypothetical protein [Candidatus Gastranaerophilales bacterium]